MDHPRRCVQQRHLCGSEGERSIEHANLRRSSLQTQVPRLQMTIGLTTFRSRRLTAPAAANGSALSQPTAPATPVAAADAASQADASQKGWHRVSLKFHAPAAGVHQMQVICMSDYWVGCDARVSLKLKVLKAKKESIADVKQQTEAAGQDESGDEVEGGDGELTESGTSESDTDT